MARESSLWQRCKTGMTALKERGHRLHIGRIENTAGEGNPDVNGCIDGRLFDIELKSVKRPAKPSTKLRPKLRDSQQRWHRDRTEAGCRRHWVLIQVGHGHTARLYLVSGDLYGELIAPEAELELISSVSPSASVADVLVRASHDW